MSEQTELKVEFDTKDLTPAQVRMIRRVCTTLMHVISTGQEDEYFEESAALLRQCASLISEANYSKFAPNQEISYSTQALEYSMEILQDFLSDSSIIEYDN